MDVTNHSFVFRFNWIDCFNSHQLPFNPLNPSMANEGIALFHTLFNCLNVVLLVGFLPRIVRLVEKTVKSKGDSDEEFKLDYITGTGGLDFLR